MPTNKTGFVRFYNIIGTDRVAASLYESGELASTHGTVTTIGSRCYGLVGTRVLPKEVEVLPVGPERSAAIGALRSHQWHVIEKVIDRVTKDPAISDHCERTTPKYEGYGFAWNDPVFAAYVSDCEAPAGDFYVEWTE